MLRFGFIMEQTLGHVTHHQNLAKMVAERREIQPQWLPITMDEQDIWQHVPVVKGNWSLQASLRARNAVARALRAGSFDALLFHTQTTALCSLDVMRRLPAIVSLDATPLNYDTVAKAYAHRADNGGWLSRRKSDWYRAAFKRAAHLVTWCEWAKRSLVTDYGVADDRITVIPPGVDIAAWRGTIAHRTLQRGERLRLLFVGGDFARKGGLLLVEAFRKGLQDTCELDIVTRDDAAVAACAGLPGVRVHTGLTPNCKPLKDLYARADLFVFPTLADCLPIAVMEAMAAGLPIVATGVGALEEEVEHGVNGLIVPPDSVDAIVESVRDLGGDIERRNAMARAGVCMAEERFDARKNYNALLNVMVAAAGK